SVPLVAGKRTFVRFHVHSVNGLYETSARLRAHLDSGEEISLLPINPGGQLVVRPTPNRAVLAHSFLFALPSDFQHAAVNLTAELNPDESPAEIDYSNNVRTTTVSFLEVPAQHVVLYNVGYEHGGTVYYPRALDRDRLESWLHRAFPLSSLGVTL